MRPGALPWDREKWQKIVRLTAEPWELAGLPSVFVSFGVSVCLILTVTNRSVHWLGWCLGELSVESKESATHIVCAVTWHVGRQSSSFYSVSFRQQHGLSVIPGVVFFTLRLKWKKQASLKSFLPNFVKFTWKHDMLTLMINCKACATSKKGAGC